MMIANLMTIGWVYTPKTLCIISQEAEAGERTVSQSQS